MPAGYKILRDGRAILCLRCDRVSFNPNDVREKYCGWCHIFHELEAAMQSRVIPDPSKQAG